MQLSSTIKLRSGNEMPILGLGTWELKHDTGGAVADALAAGYPMIDTSGDYGTQPGIAEGIGRSGAKRDSFYLVTKVEETDDAYQAARRNLDELQTDYANLILIHRPPQEGAGTALWEGLIRAREEGLARDIGVSNYPRDLIETLIAETAEVPAVNQIEWTPFGHSNDMLDYARERNMVIQAYSPLTRGKRLDDSALNTIAKEHGKTPAQVMIRWNLQRGTVPLPKANRQAHRQENLDVFDFSLSDDDMVALIRLNRHYSALGSLPYI